MTGVAGFLADLKRRHIYRVAAVYTVVAWVLIQLVGNVTPMLRLPEWAGSLVLVLLAVGFPLALIFAWIHEPPASATATDVSPAVTSKLDWVIAGGIVIVIAGILHQLVAGSSNQVQAELVAAPEPGTISIAVLPLANLSGDPQQEFMSDGMADEITTALARVASLRVVGRSSAFQFKGQGKDLRAIGQALGASHLIDGSLRRSGSRVRVTAQLVRAEDGIELWTDSYERELTDLFAIQEDIAQAIAGELRAPLGLGEGERLVSNRTADVASYEAYLRGRSLVRERAVARGVALGIVGIQMTYWSPAWAPARNTQRFKDWVANVGLVDYWKQHGWPDLCRPRGADDFACD